MLSLSHSLCSRWECQRQGISSTEFFQKGTYFTIPPTLSVLKNYPKLLIFQTETSKSCKNQCQQIEKKYRQITIASKNSSVSKMKNSQKFLSKSNNPTNCQKNPSNHNVINSKVLETKNYVKIIFRWCCDLTENSKIGKLALTMLWAPL